MEIETSAKWRKALDKVVSAVVLLRTTSTRAFDTSVAGISNGTGFIVDKERGIILTSRRVVKAGPVVAEATFLNREEIPVYPIYRDPVHDFGFFRFDPAALQFMKCDEIPLAPEAAAVGLDIRVVGIGSGESLSIMAGTMGRLDREAPHYRKDGYNDFNTFYMQAASRIQGGSSGSPVIDCDGQAVGLNAGGKNESCAAFFLPLDRVLRALKIIQNCKDGSAVHIPRGTLEMTLVHIGFDEARRLGLQRDTEQFARQAFPAETGILTINSIVPGGPASALKKPLKSGDILVRVNGEIVTQFLQLETVLDDNVGKRIDLEVERNGVPLKSTVQVQDLHSITPHCFLEVSGGVLHSLSYQQARNFSLKCGLVYVAEPGHMLSRAGVPRHAIIQKLAGTKITGIEDFIANLSKFSRGAMVKLEFKRHDCSRTKSVLITVDRHEWYAEPQLYSRDDVTGLWNRMPVMSSFTSGKAGQRGRQNKKSSKVTDQNVSDSESDDSDDSAEGGKVIEPSLVKVNADIPSHALIEGVNNEHLSGTGVVIYHSKTVGIVAVDKNTVPISLSDVTLLFKVFPKGIPGEVVFLHPVHNYALVAYDPAALGPSGATAVRAAALLPEPALRKGEGVNLFGLNKRLKAASHKCIVTNPVAALNIDSADCCPRYRAMNMEVIELENNFGDTCSGILADKLGRVRALWGKFSTQKEKGKDDDVEDEDEDGHSFVRGIPIYAVSEVLQKIINGTQGSSVLKKGIKMSMPLVRILEVELGCTLLLNARNFGLSDKWIRKLRRRDPLRRHVLQVKGCWAGSKAEHTLKPGDMLLAIDGNPITKFRDIENACQRLDECKDQNGHLRMTVFREGLELELLVGTDVRDGFGTKHIVSWSGCIVHEPHHAVRALGFFPEEGNGVYVSFCFHGNPVSRYAIYENKWIVEINGKPTPDLHTFVDVIKELRHEEFVRVKTIELDGQTNVFTLKQDLHYWPTWELIFKPETWSWDRINH